MSDVPTEASRAIRLANTLDEIQNNGQPSLLRYVRAELLQTVAEELTGLAAENARLKDALLAAHDESAGYPDGVPTLVSEMYALVVDERDAADERKVASLLDRARRNPPPAEWYDSPEDECPFYIDDDILDARQAVRDFQADRPGPETGFPPGG